MLLTSLKLYSNKNEICVFELLDTVVANHHSKEVSNQKRWCLFSNGSDNFSQAGIPVKNIKS